MTSRLQYFMRDSYDDVYRLVAARFEVLGYAIVALIVVREKSLIEE